MSDISVFYFYSFPFLPFNMNVLAVCPLVSPIAQKKKNPFSPKFRGNIGTKYIFFTIFVQFFEGFGEAVYQKKVSHICTSFFIFSLT